MVVQQVPFHRARPLLAFPLFPVVLLVELGQDFAVETFLGPGAYSGENDHFFRWKAITQTGGWRSPGPGKNDRAAGRRWR
jgi:hypothetical protein